MRRKLLFCAVIVLFVTTIEKEQKAAECPYLIFQRTKVAQNECKSDKECRKDYCCVKNKQCQGSCQPSKKENERCQEETEAIKTTCGCSYGFECLKDGTGSSFCKKTLKDPEEHTEVKKKKVKRN
ncbi:uncharacterized protein LOC124815598 isoform X1 [Hydra vulgaris]|uniref:uncharacterized protein LOC124815598 isoform X1 n=1 Tax=Hydra vulgaris TaxID=6087 RepID=UPI0032EA237D